MDPTILYHQTLTIFSIHLIFQVNQRSEGLKNLVDLEELARKKEGITWELVYYISLVIYLI